MKWKISLSFVRTRFIYPKIYGLYIIKNPEATYDGSFPDSLYCVCKKLQNTPEAIRSSIQNINVSGIKILFMFQREDSIATSHSCPIFYTIILKITITEWHFFVTCFFYCGLTSSITFFYSSHNTFYRGIAEIFKFLFIVLTPSLH